MFGGKEGKAQDLLSLFFLAVVINFSIFFEDEDENENEEEAHYVKDDDDDEDEALLRSMVGLPCRNDGRQLHCGGD